MDDAQNKSIETTTDGSEVEQTTQDVVETTEVKSEHVDNAEILKKIEEYDKKLRVFQSEKDRAVQDGNATAKQLAEAQRKLKIAESTVEGLRRKYGDDPDIIGSLDDTVTKARLKAFEDDEQLSKAREKEQTEEAVKIQKLIGAVQQLGVDPKHEDLVKLPRYRGESIDDFGIRLLSKAAELKAGGSKVSSVDPRLEELQTELANLKKALGTGSDGYSSPGGGGESGNIKDLLAKYAAGDDLSSSEEKKVKEHLASLG